MDRKRYLCNFINQSLELWNEFIFIHLQHYIDNIKLKFIIKVSVQHYINNIRVNSLLLPLNDRETQGGI